MVCSMDRSVVCRIIAAVARQHLLPPVLATVSERFGTPWVSTLLAGVATALIALFTGKPYLLPVAEALPSRRCTLTGKGVQPSRTLSLKETPCQDGLGPGCGTPKLIPEQLPGLTGCHAVLLRACRLC